MRLCKEIFVIALLAFTLIIPVPAWAAEGQGITGGNVPPSFNVPNDAFHSPGHMQRWYNSPMAGQNPHLWTAFSLILTAGLISAVVLLIRNRQKAATEATAMDKTAKFLADLQAKEKRLITKIADLDAKLSKGEISQEEYDLLRDEYCNQLSAVSYQQDGLLRRRQ